MGRFTQNGVVYEEMANGNVRVIGYADDDRSSVPTVVAPNPSRVAAGARDDRRDDITTDLAIRRFGQDTDERPQKRGDTLRGDFNGRQEVKDYRIGITNLMTALKTRPDGQGDSSLIYAYAKAMDPGSVVRESEMEMAGSTSSAIETTVAKLKKQLGIEGGGQLSPEARDNLRREMNTKVAQLAKAYGVARRDFQELAQRQGVNPEDVVGRSPAEPHIKEYQRLMNRHGMQPAGELSNPGGWQFNDQSGPASPLDGMPRLSSQDEAFIAQNARFMTPESMERWFAERKMPLPAGNAQKVYNYYAKGGADAPAVNPDERAYLAQLDAANAKRPAPGYTDLFQNGFTASGIPILAGVGGGIASTLNGEGFESGYTFNRDAQRRAIEQTRERLGVPGAVAEGAGIVGGSIGLGQMGAAAFPRAASALPAGMRTLVNDMAFGAAYGANEAAPGEGLDGAVRGSLTAGAGNLAGQAAGRFLVAPIATSRAAGKVRRMFGAGVPEAVSPAESMVVGAAGKGGLDDIRSSLTEAQDLGVPMSLADTSANLRTLAGSAVRRSPTASGFAEDTLIPRSRGQIDRFTTAVERDLGPVGNIPQMSEDLIKQAQARAAPLYDEAYASPVVSTPELDALLNTPFGRQGLSRARTIAANERRDPEAMGFRLDADGNVALEPTVPMTLTSAGSPGGAPVQQPGYTTQTLDYAKRGMDDVLEQYRNPITGRLELDEAGKAQNGVLRSFLGEVDRINPAYGQARAAYAGPAAERDAMRAGQRAYSQDPNTLGVQMNGQTPERIGQMQLGYRDALMSQGNKVRYSSNPFDATLGTPQAEARLRTMYPETAGVDRLLRTRDLERGLAATTNDILGNSKTAQRLMADQAFGGDDAAQMGLDAIVNIATGQVPVGLVAKKGIADAAKDAFTMGVGKRAIRKADELAPILMNPDPGAALSQLDDILARNQAYADYVGGVRRNATRVGRMFAAPLGMQYATAP